MIGSTISHYKILEKLGEGGMGVVYKAQDTKLDRTVALKFLPAHVSVNEETKARFLQEAKAAASLNHAHICTIHGIEEEGGQMFIVMEYIEGGTLREKLPYAKVDDALNVAIQIGEALQEAHAKGIVHRDIKADNIMLTSKGQAKVMDFGLAKLKGSLKLTKTSSTVGTLAYMAPEQIQGGEVDARSDIFSFGVVLYEMLTGHVPFRGEHEAAMVYSIVNEEPTPIQNHIPEISSEVVHILNRALEKDPEDRYQTVHDMVIDLRRLKKQTSHVSRLIPAMPPAGPHVAVSEKSAGSLQSRLITKRALLVIGTIVAAFVVVSYFLFFAARSVQLNLEMSSRVLQIPLSQIGYPGLSSDGNWIAFPAADANGKWDVYFMNISGGEPRKITADSAAGIQRAEISPDGGRIVYDVSIENSSEIRSVSALGSEEKVLFENAFTPAWQPDGKRIFFFRGFFPSSRSKSGKLEIWSGKPDGSDERLEFVDTVFSMTGRYSLSISPDGRFVVWQRTFPTEGTYEEIFTRNLENGEERQLTFDKKKIDEVCWARNGQIIYSTNKGGSENLWMVPATGGTPIQITKGIGPDLGINISADNKRLLYYQAQTTGNLWIMSLKDGSTNQITFDEGYRLYAALSPDGKRIAFDMYDPDPLRNIRAVYVIDRDGANKRQITSGDQLARFPSWSPDGRWISYLKANLGLNVDDPEYIQSYIVDASRPTAPKFLANGRPQWINADEIVTWTATKSWVVSVQSGEKKQLYEDSTYALPIMGGKYILYQDLRHGKEGVWIVEAKSSPAKTRRLLPGNLVLAIYRSILSVSYNQFRNEFVYLTRNHELWKMHLPDGRKEKIQASFRGRLSSISFQGSGNEIVFADSHPRDRLVLIDNLFK